MTIKLNEILIFHKKKRKFDNILIYIVFCMIISGDLGFLARPAGDWEVFDLSDLIVPSAGNPVMGKVLTNGLYERSCFRSPDYFEVHSNFTFQTQMFLSKATNTPTFYVWLVNDKEEAHLIHKEEKFNEEGWHFYDIPIDTSSPGLELPGKYLVNYIVGGMKFISKILIMVKFYTLYIKL